MTSAENLQGRNILHCWAHRSCGKTTLLRMLAVSRPERRQDIHRRRGHDGSAAVRAAVTMMFQSYALFPDMNVEQNVASA